MRRCEECERLWQEYSRATAAHIRFAGKRRIAHLQHDPEMELQLESVVKAAESDRVSAREAIREHEAVAHDETSDKLPPL
jgi:hypothetical protein